MDGVLGVEADRVAIVTWCLWACPQHVCAAASRPSYMSICVETTAVRLDVYGQFGDAWDVLSVIGLAPMVFP